EPPISYDSKTVAMPIRFDAEEPAADESAAAESVEQSSGYPLAGSDSDEGTVELQRSQARSPQRSAPERSRDSEHAPATSDELQTLAREWGDMEGSVSAMTIKSETGSASDSVKARSIHDTVESLPRRRVKATGESLDHPEYELLAMLGEG